MKLSENEPTSGGVSPARAPVPESSHLHLPSPTFWPAGLALGVTLLFWSLITSWVVFAMGAWLFVTSLMGWIREIRHERQQHS